MAYEVKCKHFEVELEQQSDLSMSELLPMCEKKIPNEAKHGDIIYVKKFLKSLDVFFLDCTEDSNGFLIEKRLTQTDSLQTGCCSVPIDVTRKIKDPVYFYCGAFNFSDYTDDDFLGIEIDATVHDELVKRFTGGKSVSKSHRCFYFHAPNEWGECGMYIWCGTHDSGKFLRLTKDINDKYLH